jgi:16S rRNA (guanine966-N2)-methyltransferase
LSVRLLKTNKLRIVAGELRSRIIEFPDAEGLRPTPDRVRETLFNWLGQTLHGKRCLDLFAGSGALGFEAASRGAEHVLMVEKSLPVYRALVENAERLRCARVTVRHQDGLEFMVRDTDRYDVIFLDPPFQSGYLQKLLDRLPGHLAQEGVVYVESGEEFAVMQPWKVLKSGRAGRVWYQLLRIE